VQSRVEARMAAMLDPNSLVAFIGAGLLLNVTPGPDVLAAA